MCIFNQHPVSRNYCIRQRIAKVRLYSNFQWCTVSDCWKAIKYVGQTCETMVTWPIIFFNPTFCTHIFDSNNIFSQHMNVRIDNIWKLYKKISNYWIPLAWLKLTTCVVLGGNIGEPKSHEILIYVCLQREFKQSCGLLIILAINYENVYIWAMWQHIIVCYDFENKQTQKSHET